LEAGKVIRTTGFCQKNNFFHFGNQTGML